MNENKCKFIDKIPDIIEKFEDIYNKGIEKVFFKGLINNLNNILLGNYTVIYLCGTTTNINDEYYIEYLEYILPETISTEDELNMILENLHGVVSWFLIPNVEELTIPFSCISNNKFSLKHKYFYGLSKEEAYKKSLEFLRQKRDEAYIKYISYLKNIVELEKLKNDE